MVLWALSLVSRAIVCLVNLRAVKFAIFSGLRTRTQDSTVALLPIRSGLPLPRLRVLLKGRFPLTPSPQTADRRLGGIGSLPMTFHNEAIPTQ